MAVHGVPSRAPPAPFATLPCWPFPFGDSALIAPIFLVLGGDILRISPPRPELGRLAQVTQMPRQKAALTFEPCSQRTARRLPVWAFFTRGHLRSTQAVRCGC